MVGEERLELSCDQLLFLQGISLRRYTPVFSWKGRIRTAVPVREQIYSLPVLTTHPPSSNGRAYLKIDYLLYLVGPFM